jgi:HPt (histidine-containing phosphotransfer) domain-containing protein
MGDRVAGGNGAGKVFGAHSGDIGDGKGCSAAAAIDEAQLIGNMAGSPEILDEAGRLFLNEAQGMFLALQAAVASADASRVERAAHLIKGALLSLAAPTAARLAEAIEAQGRAGSPVSPARLGEFELELTRVRSVLGEILDRFERLEAVSCP